MPDFNFGIQNTEEFSVDTPSAIDAFLNGELPVIEKVDPKKEEADNKKKAKPPIKAEKPKEEDEEEDTDPQEEVDVLEVLDDEEEETPKKKEKKEGEEENEEPESNQFEVISQQLYDMGIFLQDEEGEPVLATSGEELATMFQENAQKQALRNLDAFLRSRGDDRMDLFEAIFVNGVDPKEYLPVYNQVQNFQEMDMTIEANQERVYREYYKRLKWDSNKIESRLQKIKDYGDLQEEAEEMHQKLIEQDEQVLKTQEETKKAEELKKKATEQQYQAAVQKVVVDAMKAKELEGFPITESTAKSLYSFLVEPKYKLPNGDVITEFDKLHLESKRPENIKQRVLSALLYLNNFDFSKIEKKAISKETNALFSGLKKTSVKSKTQKPAQTGDFWNQL